MRMDRKIKISVALKKAKTSIEKILAAIEAEDVDCFPVIQQNLAVIGLLKSVNVLMLESHMERTAQNSPAIKQNIFEHSIKKSSGLLIPLKINKVLVVPGNSFLDIY